MKRLILGAVLFAILATPVAAGPYEDAFAAYKSGAYLTALTLWRPLANQGNVHAQYGLGTMYDNGQGVPQDYAETVKWYRTAADQGNAYAQYNLGIMYANGQGVPQDYATAVKWFRKAADQGNANAQHNLGVMYDNGDGVPQDFVEAHKWYNLAAARATDKETRDIGIHNRDLVAVKMTPAQIAEAQKLARQWKPKSL